MHNPTPYVLWGSAGHAKVLASLINLQGDTVIALFDNNPEANQVLDNVPLYIGIEGFKSWILKDNRKNKVRGLAAIGGALGRDRLGIHQLFRNYGLIIQSIIHPLASICKSATIDQGTQVLAYAIIAADAKIGEGCIINHRASVDHECILGNGVHLAPASTLCGCVNLGENVMIGAGAVVLPRLRVGNDTIVGAGAVVTCDLPASVVAFGNPARIIRRR